MSRMWRVAVSVTSFLLLSTSLYLMKPDHMISRDGKLKTFGISDSDRTSIFSFSFTTFLIAIFSAFVPVVTELCNPPSISYQSSGIVWHRSK